MLPPAKPALTVPEPWQSERADGESVLPVAFLHSDHTYIVNHHGLIGEHILKLRRHTCRLPLLLCLPPCCPLIAHESEKAMVVRDLAPILTRRGQHFLARATQAPERRPPWWT